jgi:hypothetical protein
MSSSLRDGRLLIAAGLIFGLFLMHGLTADHETAMPMTAGATHTAMGSAQHAPTTSTPNLPHTHGATVGALAEMGLAAADSMTDTASALSAVAGHGPGGELCLALLGTGLLLPILVRRRPRRLAPSADAAGVLLMAHAAARHRASLPPSLSRLCVSRT